MFSFLLQFSLRNRLLILLTTVVAVALGVFITFRLPVDVFPDLTAPTVTVLTEAHGMAPEEVETMITYPIETALNGATGVRRVRSSSAAGISIVWVEFDWDMDIFIARQIVNEKLQLASGSLPERADRPVMAPITSIMGEIMLVGMRHELINTERNDEAAMQLRRTSESLVRRRLLSIPGVAQIIPMGGSIREFQVQVSPQKLAAYDLTFEDVLHSVKRVNAASSGGIYNDRGTEYLIRGMGRVHDIEDIRNSVVATRNGIPILLAAIAAIEIGAAPRIGTASTDGEASVILTIQKQPHANTLDITEAIDRAVEEIRPQLPEGISIDAHVFRQADFITRAIDNVVGALRDGAILVVLILLLFLSNIRVTVLSVIAIPLSLLITFLVFHFAGIAINTMTLGGMAIAIGALVDDAIIYVENVFRRLRLNLAIPEHERQETRDVILSASKEILSPMVHATFIIIIVFLPLFFLSGLEGRLLLPMGIAYVTSILASLIVAVTVTPVLSSFLLPKAAEKVGERESRLLTWMRAAYERTLAIVLVRSRLVLIGAGFLLVSALAMLPFLGRSFLPEFNEGALTITLITMPGTSLDESDAIGGQAEALMLALPEVEGTARRTGRAELDEHAQGSNVSEMDVRYTLGDRSRQQFLQAVRKELSTLPGTNATIGQPLGHRIDHMLSGTRANIALKIFGTDLAELANLAEAARAELETIDGIVDLSVEQRMHVPQVAVRFNRAAMAAYGVSAYGLADIIDAAFAGEAVTSILEGTVSTNVVVRYEASARRDIQAIRDALIDTPSGARVQLRQLADVRYDFGPHSISRENVQRKMVVQANVAGRDLHSTVEEIRTRLETDVAFPQGYYYELGGQFESEQAATQMITGLSLLSIAAIFLILFLEFRSIKLTALVMVNLPLALIGGLWSVQIIGGVVNVAALVGFITLFGIATRNGVLMISHYQRLEGEGCDHRETVLRGSLERLSPIMMTALTAALALLPLAFGIDEPGKEIEAPMAIVILGGLLTSTALNMIVIPALYFRYGTRRQP
ncbi:MAG: CusA/CzcA family heavy metal efflux RND transporter [Ignavibacteria bacterium]|nr:MAG: CusA/CzcA family heavy metal efflux RND transporter [Ignavibacteria bacterium]